MPGVQICSFREKVKGKPSNIIWTNFLNQPWVPEAICQDSASKFSWFWSIFLKSLYNILACHGHNSLKIGFQDGGYGGHFGFPIGTIVIIFHLRVNLLLHRKFQLN